MDLSQIEAIARSHLLQRQVNPDREPGWLYYHGRRTARIAQTIMERTDQETNPELLFAGCLLHDLGKGSEPHQEIGAELARDLLAPHCSAEELEIVCDLILLHNQRGRPGRHSPAVRALQDADMLDHVGPVGIWLACYRSGNRGQSGVELLEFSSGGTYHSGRQEMRRQLNFQISQTIFDARLAWERSFFDSFGTHYFNGVSMLGRLAEIPSTIPSQARTPNPELP